MHLDIHGRIGIQGVIEFIWGDQQCSISSLLFNFVGDQVMVHALEGPQNVGVKIANWEKLCDLGYADDLVGLIECTEQTQCIV